MRASHALLAGYGAGVATTLGRRPLLAVARRGAPPPRAVAWTTLAAGAVALAALLALRAAPMPPRQIGRLLWRRHAPLTFQKTLTVRAPLASTFAFFSDFARFPQFMRHVRAVTDLGAGRSRWVVRGPLGAKVEWTARITRLDPPRLIAWKTEPGGGVEHAGLLHLERDGDKTRVHVRLTYNPPAGAMGHALAALCGADPKQEMDEDLGLAKASLEARASAAGTEVRRC